MSKKILAVDDSATVLASIKGMLSGVYEVHTAAGTKQAESVLETLRPDLMLLDIDMPGGDGISFLKKLKKKTGYDFPIVFLSSNSGSENVVKTAQLGATGFIEKPFDKDKLLAKIEAWLH
ncbi:MAG: response regulator [Oscillospiraceae bacterium]|jgi:DNA-binding response OmpR family regulator|nr:response regulator [Oscillospiraceae bacterium]